MILRKINGAVHASFLYEMDFQVCSYKKWTLDVRQRKKFCDDFGPYNLTNYLILLRIRTKAKEIFRSFFFLRPLVRKLCQNETAKKETDSDFQSAGPR